MIYPAPAIRVGPPPTGFEEVRISLDESGGEGAWVHGWHHEPAGGARQSILFFHGNGENLETMRMAGSIDRLAGLGAHLLAIDYPGYGSSPGKPSEEGLTAAAAAASRWLERRHPEARQVAVGWSLGAAVAAGLAAERPRSIAGTVLISAWTRLDAVARLHFPGFLVGLALSERYDSLAAAERIAGPVLLIHGADDAIIPASQGRELAAALGGRARWVEVPGAGHNDLLSRAIVWAELERFVASLDG